MPGRSLKTMKEFILKSKLYIHIHFSPVPMYSHRAAVDTELTATSSYQRILYLFLNACERLAGKLDMFSCAGLVDLSD